MKRSDELAMALAPIGALPPAMAVSDFPALFVLGFGAVVSYLLALALGWPALVLLRRLGWTRVWHLGTAGIVLAAAPAAVLSAFGIRTAIGIMLAGALGGTLVWWLAVGPNNSSKPTPLRGAA